MPAPRPCRKHAWHYATDPVSRITVRQCGRCRRVQEWLPAQQGRLIGYWRPVSTAFPAASALRRADGSR